MSTVALAVALLAAPAASAQAAMGSVSGVVTQAATRDRLENAVVEVVGTGLKTLTDSTGAFTLANVPEGVHQLRFSYTGLEPVEETVTVSGAGNVHLSTALGSGIYVLGQYVVSSEREGSAKAIQDQRFAQNLKTVISADQFGGVADGSIDDALKRLPGITYQTGEFSVRGIPNQLNSVEVNGIRLASAAGGLDTLIGEERAVKTNRIPGDLIEKIEVIKGLTPDRSADSIGGTINLITKSAFTSTGRRIRLNAAFSRLGDLEVKPETGYALNASYSDVVGVWGQKENLGIFVSASRSDLFVPVDRPFRAAEQIGIFHTGDPTLATVPDSLRLSWNEDQRERTNVGTKFDLKWADHSVFSLDLAVNQEDNRREGERVRIRSQGLANTQVLQNGQWIPAAQATAVADQVRYIRGSTGLEHVLENYETRGYRVSLRGDHRPGPWHLRWVGALSRDRTTRYRSNGGGTVVIDSQNTSDIIIDRTNRKFPMLELVGGAVPIYDDLTNVNRMGSQHLRLQDQWNEDEIASGSVDLKRTFLRFQESYLQLGSAWRQQERQNNQEAIRNFRYTGADFTQFAGPPANAFGRFNTRHGSSVAAVARDFAANPQNWLSTTTANNILAGDEQNDGFVKEAILGSYFMGYAEFGKLGVLTGVRHELTRVEGEGTFIDPSVPIPERYSQRARSKGDYESVFPSAHLKYLFRPNLQGRLSYSTGIGRPSFTNLRPRTDINRTTLRITQSNPDLKPQYSKGLDVSLEWYFEPAGSLSIGAFRKDITDYIRSETVLLDGTGGSFGPEYAGYELVRRGNAGRARVQGVEIGYNQQFNFLPGLFKGLGAFANFTYLESQSDYDDAVQELANIIPRSINFGISYSLSPISIRLLGYYRSGYLLEFNNNPYGAFYREANLEYDLKLSYTFRERYTFYCDVFNVFEDEPVTFAGGYDLWDRATYINRRPRRFDFGVRVAW